MIEMSLEDVSETLGGLVLAVGQVDPLSKSHLYYSWNPREGHHKPLHAIEVVDHEFDMFVANFPSKNVFGRYEVWTQDMVFAVDHSKVDCEYCKEWIHA